MGAELAIIFVQGAQCLIDNNKVGRPSLTLRGADHSLTYGWGSGSFDSQVYHSVAKKVTSPLVPSFHIYKMDVIIAPFYCWEASSPASPVRQTEARGDQEGWRLLLKQLPVPIVTRHLQTLSKCGNDFEFSCHLDLMWEIWNFQIDRETQFWRCWKANICEKSQEQCQHLSLWKEINHLGSQFTASQSRGSGYLQI